MGGFTKHEKEMYEQCGYHNYKEFINDLDNLLIAEYGENHNISYTMEATTLCMKKYKKEIENHIVTFDVSKCENNNLSQLYPSGIIKSDGREMYRSFIITGDIEEAIDDGFILS